MTWISIPGPKHTFLLVAVQPESSNFEKKIRPLVCIWSLSWHMSVTGLLWWMCSGLSAEKSWIPFLVTPDR